MESSDLAYAFFVKDLISLLHPPEASDGYFGLAFATPPPSCVEIFALIGKLHQLGSPNLQDVFLGGKASLGLKLASF